MRLEPRRLIKMIRAFTPQQEKRKGNLKEKRKEKVHLVIRTEGIYINYSFSVYHARYTHVSLSFLHHEVLQMMKLKFTEVK